MAFIYKTDFYQTSVNDPSYKPECNAILFKNTGDTPAKLNNVWVLQPGETTPTISTGHPDAVDMTTYSISFDPAGGGTNPQITAILMTAYPANTSGSGNGDACEKF